MTQSVKGAAADARRMHLACLACPFRRAHTLARMADAPAVAVSRAVGHAHRSAAVDAAEADGADALALDARAVAGAQAVDRARHSLGTVRTAPTLDALTRARSANAAPRAVVDAARRTHRDSLGALGAGIPGSARALASHAQATARAVGAARELALVAGEAEGTHTAPVEARAVPGTALLALERRERRWQLARDLARDLGRL